MYSVLLVDDEKIIREGVYELLSMTELDLDLTMAASAVEALAVLEARKIDIVVMDICMPQMSGLDLYDVIRQKWPHSKLIFLTGHLEFNYVYKVHRHARYVLKAEEDEKIVEAVRESIEEIENDLLLERMTLDHSKYQHRSKYYERLLLLKELVEGSISSSAVTQEMLDEMDTGLELTKEMYCIMMHETYEDCPFYEQLQYAMDSRSEILYTYMTSGDDRLARQCMDDFRRSQRADGMINCCYPHWGPNIIPGFAIYYIMMVYDHMMFFGDQKLVKKHLGAIDGILEYFDNHLEDRGVVGKTGGHISERYWSFIDWSVPWGPTVGTPPSGLHGPITMESFLYIMGLQHAAKLCDYVGRTGTATEYRTRAAQVQKAINTYCRDEEGFYLDSPGVKDYSQHCQVFAVLTDTVPLEEGKKLVLATLDDPDKFAQCTVAAMFYVFRALEKIGAYDRTEALWETWRGMLRNNLSTCVENYVGERSDCHAWGSLLLHELPAVILGVRPAAPGFEKVAIAPVPGYLDWAKGDVVTPWGNVHVEWTKNADGKLDLHYQVPEEMKEKVEVHV